MRQRGERETCCWKKRMIETSREVANKVVIQKVGERTNLLLKLIEKKGEGQMYVDEDLTGQVRN